MREEIKIRLNSSEKIEQVIQESYDLTCKAIREIQNEMDKLMATNLADASMDDKAKYANAMHNYIKDKKDAIGQKVDIAKLMAEVLKFNGNTKAALESGAMKATKLDLKAIRSAINDVVNSENEVIYDTKDKD